MKKVLLFSFIIIVIPTLIVNVLIKDEEIKFEYVKNIYVRIKRENQKIDKIELEDYVVGVLAGEMPTTFHFEALKAQAVAARTYVLKKMEQNKGNNYDVVDTVMNQVYLDNDYLKETWKDDYDDKINLLKMAVLETAGKYMIYNNKIIEAFYFSTSPGYTENCEDVFNTQLPYLRSVESSWDEISPVYRENKYFTIDDFYNKTGIQRSDILKVEYLSKTSTGRIKTLKINNITKNAKEIVNNLNLRSSFFIITQIKNIIKIETKGYGHGVGMSQYGAEAMSRKGYKYDEILKYYYNNIEIKNLYKF